MKLSRLNANFTKWSNTVKQFVGKLPTNCLTVFDHFLGLALKRLGSIISFITFFGHYEMNPVFVTGQIRHRKNFWCQFSIWVLNTHLQIILILPVLIGFTKWWSIWTFHASFVCKICRFATTCTFNSSECS